MEAYANKPGSPILIAAGIATACIVVMLLCAAAIAAIMDWIPVSEGGGAAPQTADAPAKLAAQGPAQAPEKHSVLMANPGPGPEQVAGRATCADCGVIESVRAVAINGKATGLGGVGGAVVGGVLGNQFGAGRGTDVMTVVGAVGGAVAGNEIEKRTNLTTRYRITVRFDDGSSRVFRETSAPAWRAGDRVKIVGGQIRSNNV